jgi:hypothetical protein
MMVDFDLLEMQQQAKDQQTNPTVVSNDMELVQTLTRRSKKLDDIATKQRRMKAQQELEKLSNDQ